jgi:hypothetical protein
MKRQRCREYIRIVSYKSTKYFVDKSQARRHAEHSKDFPSFNPHAGDFKPIASRNRILVRKMLDSSAPAFPFRRLDRVPYLWLGKKHEILLLCDELQF